VLTSALEAVGGKLLDEVCHIGAYSSQFAELLRCACGHGHTGGRGRGRWCDGRLVVVNDMLVFVAVPVVLVVVLVQVAHGHLHVGKA